MSLWLTGLPVADGPPLPRWDAAAAASLVDTCRRARIELAAARARQISWAADARQEWRGASRDAFDADQLRFTAAADDTVRLLAAVEQAVLAASRQVDEQRNQAIYRMLPP